MATRKRNSKGRTAPPVQVDDRPPATDSFAIVDQAGALVAYDCGHTSAARFTLDLFGTVTPMDFSADAKRPTCGVCSLERLRKAVIRCAVCGHPIMPGEPIVAYEKVEGMRPECCTVIRSGTPEVVVGCLDYRCRTVMGMRYGTWMGTGFRLGPAPVILRVRLENGRAVFVEALPGD